MAPDIPDDDARDARRDGAPGVASRDGPAEAAARASAGAAPADAPLTVGWREWVALPALGLPAIKAKVDTGARTSALHAFDIAEERGEGGAALVGFSVHPLQRDGATAVRCRAPLVDRRTVTDSGGHREERWVIATTLALGGRSREVEVTLVDRTDMLFRMLVGRTSLVPDVLVNPARSFLLGRTSARGLYAARGDAAAGTPQSTPR